MTEHKVGTREEWLAARTALLADEKVFTHRSDELARKRQALPWVPIGKDYSFEAEDGTKTLADLFDGRSQLLVYHFMFGPTVEGSAGCGLPGLLVHRRQPRRRRRPSPAAGRDLRRRLACPAREPTGGTDVLNATWQLLDRTPRVAATTPRGGRADTTTTND